MCECNCFVRINYRYCRLLRNVNRSTNRYSFPQSLPVEGQKNIGINLPLSTTRQEFNNYNNHDNDEDMKIFQR